MIDGEKKELVCMITDHEELPCDKMCTSKQDVLNYVEAWLDNDFETELTLALREMTIDTIAETPVLEL